MGAYSYDDRIEIPGLARRRRWLTALALVVLLAAAALFAGRRIRANLASLLPMAAPISTPARSAAPGTDVSSLPKESAPDTSHPAPVTHVATSASSTATATVSPSVTTATRKANSGATPVAAAPPASESVLTRAGKPEHAAHFSRPPSGSIVRGTPF
jgi:hypothetical protein